MSGAREQIRSRNEAMIYAYQSGKTVGEIAREYFLSEDTIRKIVYGKNDYTNTRSNIAN